eukprot:s1151_g5.t1
MSGSVFPMATRRVARATIGVQYCALLSHAGRHSQALNEALAAVVEAEEVWYSLGHETSEVTAEAASVRERLIPSLHQEAPSAVSRKL